MLSISILENHVFVTLINVFHFKFGNILNSVFLYNNGPSPDSRQAITVWIRVFTFTCSVFTVCNYKK